MPYKTVILKGGAKVTFDPEKTSECKRCHKIIWWATTINAKSMPIIMDKDGEWISHFADCNVKRLDDLLSDLQRQKTRDGWR